MLSQAMHEASDHLVVVSLSLHLGKYLPHPALPLQTFLASYAFQPMKLLPASWICRHFSQHLSYMHLNYPVWLLCLNHPLAEPVGSPLTLLHQICLLLRQNSCPCG